MKDNPSLVFDLVEWVAREPRSYAEVMDAWRTSCPRLTIWEDAVDQGLVERQYRPGEGTVVAVTEKGLAYLARGRPAAPAEPRQWPAPPSPTTTKGAHSAG